MRGYKEYRHWSTCNAIMRVVGIMFAFVGTVFISWGVYFAVHPRAVNGNDQVMVYCALGLFAGVVGFAVLKIRPYRPDLGDTVSFSAPGSRNWWTGDPKKL